MPGRFQFSLRALMLATAVAAVFSLGLAVLIREYLSFTETMRYRYEVEVPRLMKEGKPLPWERGYIPEPRPAKTDRKR